MPPDALETLLSGAAEDVDMVVCPHETFDERGHAWRVWPETRWYRQNGEQKKNAVVLRLIEGDCVLNICLLYTSKRKLVPMMLAGALLLSAAPAQAVTLPMFKQQESDTVTISREEYESYQRYQKMCIRDRY